MSLGRRASERQREFWVSCEDLAATPRHVFYDRLNDLLADGAFDDFVEDLGAPFYAENSGRPGVPLGVYFRMLFVGYFIVKRGRRNPFAPAEVCHQPPASPLPLHSGERYRS